MLPDHNRPKGDGAPGFPNHPALTLDVGGALRYNFVYRDWSTASREQRGVLVFDTFRINADGTYGRVDAKLEWIRYGHDPANPADQDDAFVVMGLSPALTASTNCPIRSICVWEPNSWISLNDRWMSNRLSCRQDAHCQGVSRLQ